MRSWISVACRCICSLSWETSTSKDWIVYKKILLINHQITKTLTPTYVIPTGQFNLSNDASMNTHKHTQAYWSYKMKCSVEVQKCIDTFIEWSIHKKKISILLYLPVLPPPQHTHTHTKKKVTSRALCSLWLCSEVTPCSFSFSSELIFLTPSSVDSWREYAVKLPRMLKSLDI